MPRFFIDRPIFAWVIALFIIVLGGVAVSRLPVAQYPDVVPPTVVVGSVRMDVGRPSTRTAALYSGWRCIGS